MDRAGGVAGCLDVHTAELRIGAVRLPALEDPAEEVDAALEVDVRGGTDVPSAASGIAVEIDQSGRIQEGPIATRIASEQHFFAGLRNVVQNLVGLHAVEGDVRIASRLDGSRDVDDEVVVRTALERYQLGTTEVDIAIDVDDVDAPVTGDRSVARDSGKRLGGRHRRKGCASVDSILDRLGHVLLEDAAQCLLTADNDRPGMVVNEAVDPGRALELYLCVGTYADVSVVRERGPLEVDLSIVQRERRKLLRFPEGGNDSAVARRQRHPRQQQHCCRDREKTNGAFD